MKKAPSVIMTASIPNPWSLVIIVLALSLSLPSVARGAKKDTGEKCLQDSQCKSHMCTDHACAPKVRIGKPCSNSKNCLSGVCYDFQTSGVQNRCVPRPGKGKAGQYCTLNDQCKSGVCFENACKTASGTSMLEMFEDVASKAKTKKLDQIQDTHPSIKLGESCKSNQDCLSGYCDAGLGSGNSNRCVPAAGTGKGGDYCSQNAHCATKKCVAKKCTAQKGLGEPCPGGNAQCLSGWCDSGMGSGGTNRCVPAAGTGKTGDYCSQNAHCATKACVAKKCSAKKGLGQPCPGGNAQCLSGWCDSGMGSGGTDKCVPAAGTGKKGDYCSQNGHCKPGYSCKSHACK